MLHGIELVCSVIFLVEYVLRVWVCVENPVHGPGWKGRLHYLRSPAAVLDLIALTPLVTSLVGGEAFVLRFVRLLRLLRLARFGRLSAALTHLREAIRSRAFELVASLWIALILLLVTSTLMYLVEGRVQPETFGSIPRAMWWSIVTLTTVGYGDVVPVTAAGRILAGCTAVDRRRPGRNAHRHPGLGVQRGRAAAPAARGRRVEGRALNSTAGPLPRGAARRVVLLGLRLRSPGAPTPPRTAVPSRACPARGSS